MSDLFDVRDKVVLITGSSRGIGYELARGFVRAGAKVLLNGRSQDALNSAVSSLKQEGQYVFAYCFNVADEEQVEKNVAAIQAEFGAVDVLVNNAGIIYRAPLQEFSLDDWETILKVNLTAVFIMSRAVIGKMIERRRGKIINICSMQSEAARPTIAAYAASKGGVKMLTKSMAAEWGKYNIQVNGLGPGYFVTELTRSLQEDVKFDAWLCARTPAARWGDPAELVGAAIFLSSKASDYVNGHILYVDGGLLAAV